METLPSICPEKPGLSLPPVVLTERPELDELTLERVLEELETLCHQNMARAIETQEGLGIEYDEDVVCDVCRSPEGEDGNEMVFCDKCNVCVHQVASPQLPSSTLCPHTQPGGHLPGTGHPGCRSVASLWHRLLRRRARWEEVTAMSVLWGLGPLGPLDSASSAGLEFMPIG